VNPLLDRAHVDSIAGRGLDETLPDPGRVRNATHPFEFRHALLGHGTAPDPAGRRSFAAPRRDRVGSILAALRWRQGKRLRFAVARRAAVVDLGPDRDARLAEVACLLLLLGARLRRPRVGVALARAIRAESRAEIRGVRRRRRVDDYRSTPRFALGRRSFESVTFG